MICPVCASSEFTDSQFDSYISGKGLVAINECRTCGHLEFFIRDKRNFWNKCEVLRNGREAVVGK